ncbi:aldo/keto reductase [Streptomyces sp. L7]
MRWALDAGYRHIDTAQAYGNESSVGRALRDSGIPRDEVFVTTKFQPRSGDPVAQAEASLRRLGLEQVDLYLVHWPAGGPTKAWAGMEQAKERGLARSIGVSNYDVAELEAVIAASTIPPAVNQILFNPPHNRRALLAACARFDVAVEAYSPLGTGRYVDDPTVAGIARRTGRTPAQVLLRWGVQHGLVVVAKSTHREHPRERPDPRLHAVGEGHGRTRRPRPDGRHGPRARIEVVVTPTTPRWAVAAVRPPVRGSRPVRVSSRSTPLRRSGRGRDCADRE